jgi:hypothetical protein
VTPKGNQYAIAALKDRRATMAGEIEQFKEAIRHRDDMLAHLHPDISTVSPLLHLPEADLAAEPRMPAVVNF